MRLHEAAASLEYAAGNKDMLRIQSATEGFLASLQEVNDGIEVVEEESERSELIV